MARRWSGVWMGIALIGLGWCGSLTGQEEHKQPPQTDPVGIFDAHRDVGKIGPLRGDVTYDAKSGTYTVTGSGDNMWFGQDAFQFAWKKVAGNVSLTAEISFVGEGRNAHRKAVLMVRQSLNEDAVYADVAVHGSGLTSLQYRDEPGALTREVQANVTAPKRVRIVKEGDYFRMWIAGADGRFALAGATGKVVLAEPFYVGVGVCSHDHSVVETAKFSNVELNESATSGSDGRTANSEQKGATKSALPGKKLYSMMEILDTDSLSRRLIYVAEGRFEAPNWMPDGKRLLFNRNGRVETIPVDGGSTAVVDTGFAVRCNNDHGISPDGQWLVVSDQSQETHDSLIYILPIAGGTPRRITKNAPSYWHGWSPDGKTLAFVGLRSGEFNIYTISTEGGEEKRLTTARGLDDGPEYTPGGQWIYFNSVRTGQMHIWKMKTDGSEQTQVTFDDANDWFPHFSPSGGKMVFLTFDKSVEGHPENKDVVLRIMDMKDGKITVAATLFGGQGTINVPSWSPDGKKFAFVSYAIVQSE